MRSKDGGCGFGMRLFRFAAAGLLALGGWIGASSNALAQITSATVLGTVTDPSGAALSNATVTVTNVSTGRTYSATTGSDGGYVVPLLPIVGSYKVEIEAKGFEKFVRTGVVLQVNQNARVDALLKVGAITGRTQDGCRGDCPLPGQQAR